MTVHALEPGLRGRGQGRSLEERRCTLRTKNGLCNRQRWVGVGQRRRCISIGMSVVNADASARDTGHLGGGPPAQGELVECCVHDRGER